MTRQKPRTPRYWPRMKVRGARRRRLRSMYMFQRIGDAGQVAADQLNAFGQRFINMQAAINRMHTRARLIDLGYEGPITPEQLDRLGASIMEVDSGSN